LLRCKELKPSLIAQKGTRQWEQARASVMAPCSFVSLQRARDITNWSKGNTPMGTSQSSSDVYELMCFAAKSSSHHCFLEREQADGNESEHQRWLHAHLLHCNELEPSLLVREGTSRWEQARSPVIACGSSSAMTQRTRAITGSLKGNAPTGT
jgi:hypothetical protein